MAIRTWSLTKLWAVSCVIWLAAGAFLSLVHYFEWLQLGLLAIAFTPAFLAGSWAAEHDEIARWPRFRIGSMWALVAAAVIAVGDTIDSWKLPLALFGAPVTILTLRWYEVTRGLATPDPPPGPILEPPPTTPTGTPLGG